MMACGGVRLCCLLLTLVMKALSCGGVGDLVDCAQNNPQACLCLRVTSTSGDSVVPGRTCHSSPVEIDYGNYIVREVEAGVFRYFPQLISLNLSSNSPPELILNSQSFLGLDSLSSLDLRSDGLNDLPDCLFTPLPSLETLYLQSNNLSQLNINAFGENMANLTTLYLDHNRLTELPPDLLDHLPALTSISLSSNMWDCSSPNVTVLVNLVHSGLVWNGDQLRCDNSTLVSDISIPDEPSLTPSPTPSVTPTPLPATPTLHHTPTPTPQLPRVCSRLENSGSEFGFFDWPETAAGERVERGCPHGPEGGVASRECGETGEWGAVEGGGCAAVSQTTMDLVAISQSDITVANVESVSSSLSAALSSPSPSLSTDEVEVVLDVLETLIFFPMASLKVLNYSLQAVDHLLSSSGESLLTAGPRVANRFRDVIDSALLSFLSANNTHLVLTFSHLALGGVYLTGTNHTHIVAVIATGGEGDGGLVIGEEGGGGDVEVVIDGDLEGPIQVTVYNDADIFNTTTCGENEGLEGDNDLAPVISVSDESTTGSESVTITYNMVRDEGRGGEVVCVRWNSSLNCGSGGWQSTGCRLSDHTSGSQLTCVCTDSGTFSVLDIPGTVVEPGSDKTPGVVEMVFYCSCGLGALLHLPVIIAVLFSRSLRSLPLKQCLANAGTSQFLSLLVTAASYHPHRPTQLCYSLAVLQHYTALVTLFWLAVYPVLASLKVFRRTWFERWWLLIPVAVTGWVLPAVIVGGVGGSRYGGFPDSPDICWLEGDAFPNYFTFVSGLAVVVTLFLSLLSLIVLCCSDYDLDLPIYLRIVSNQTTALLYSFTLVSIYLTADSTHITGRYQLDTDKLLIVVGVLAVLTGLYFLLANGCANTRVRSALCCREDPVLKRKAAHYYHDQGSDTLNSQASSRTSEHRYHRRHGARLADEMNLNYVDNYLGYNGVLPLSPVPLNVLDVRGGRGQRRVKERRSGGGPTGFRQVGVSIPHTTSMT